MRELELHSNPTSAAPPARRHAHLAACALMLFAGAARAQMPEAPALQRSVTPIRGMAFDHPHLPPLRTSRDGRVGVNLKTQGGELVFSVIKPESIGQAFDTLDPGVYLTHRWEGAIETPDGEPTSIAGHFEGTVRHSVLCDAPDATHPHADSGDNPRACGDNDCYDMVVLTTTRVTHASNAALNTVRLASMPITIEVGSPKTAAAGIERVIAYPDLVEHTAAFNAKDYVEPMVTTDGRMLVARIGKSNLTWYDSTGEEQTSTQEIVYAANPFGTPCDLSNFTTLEPITRAPFDAALRDDDGTPFYGIADRPFVDGEGQPIGEGELLKGTYPWIDRAGNTLFFTAVEATLSYKENEATDPQRRYDYTSTVDPDLVAPSTNEDKQPRRGVSMIGRWTRGKLVLLDNAINHTDYGLKTLDAEHVDVALYAGDEAWLRVGSARGNGADEMPGGTVTNSTFMDSFENLFNGDPNLRPVSPRDVVWRLNTGHGTDEIAFDDYLDPNALIVSEMTGSLRNTGMGRMLYGDGFYYAKNKAGFGFGFLPTSNSNARGGEVRIQNAATSTRWDLPSYGRVEGGVRMEPVALGGIVGKGLWLDGADDALVYAMPAQANPSEAWYVGLFVDARPAVGGGDRQRLITFTDGTAVDLKGRQELRLINADGTWRKRIFLPADLNASPRGWMHLGLVMKGGGEQVEIYIDGMLTRFSVDATPFGGVVDGDLRIGAHPNAPAYRGWIDELKVLAYVPGPEVLCNHARGTLARLSEGAADAWTARAAYAHGHAHTRLIDAIDTAQPGDTYVCYHDYDTTGLVGVRDVEAETGLTTVRDALLFPEGPLVADQPRPDSSGNDFCLSCHVDEANDPGHPRSLTVEVLQGGDEVDAWIDPNRQPMQPPPVLFGHVPAALFGDAADSVAPAGGYPVDCGLDPALTPADCQ